MTVPFSKIVAAHVHGYEAHFGRVEILPTRDGDFRTAISKR